MLIKSCPDADGYTASGSGAPTTALEEIWSAQTIVLEDYGLQVLNSKTLQFKVAVFYWAGEGGSASSTSIPRGYCTTVAASLSYTASPAPTQKLSQLPDRCGSLSHKS